MNDRVELAAVEPADQFAGRHHVGELAFTEIAPFAGVAERVVNYDVGPPGLVKAGDQIGPDEPGSAGDQQHPSPPPVLPSPFAPGRPGVQLPRLECRKGRGQSRRVLPPWTGCRGKLTACRPRMR